MPRIRSRNRRRTSPPAVHEDARNASFRVLSRDEKRELILAHAEARKPIHPRDRIALWGGVIVCVLFIAGAWFATAPSGIGRLWAKSSGTDVSKLHTAATELKSTLSDTSEEVQASLESGFLDAQKAVELEIAKENAREALQKKLGDEKITPDQTAPAPSNDGTLEGDVAVSSTVGNE